MREKRGNWSPSFAGITLIRFCGYNLRSRHNRREHPGNRGKFKDDRWVFKGLLVLGVADSMVVGFWLPVWLLGIWNWA
jgi:hypothetical protein